MEEALEIFRAHQVGYSDKRTFIRALTDQNTGLYVHIVQISLCSVPVRYIVNKTFTKDVFQDILHTLDTEWDKLCAKGLCAGNLTKKEMVSEMELKELSMFLMK